VGKVLREWIATGTDELEATPTKAGDENAVKRRPDRHNGMVCHRPRCHEHGFLSLTHNRSIQLVSRQERILTCMRPKLPAII